MNRIISFLHCFGIVTIVIWHAQAINGCVQLMNWIYTFCLPILFFSSGYLFSEKDFWKKKSRRILFPYFILSTLIYFPKVLLSSYALRPVEFSWHSFLYQLVLNPTENVNITLWFLPALFLTMLLFMLLRRVFHFLKCERLRWPLFALYSISAAAFYSLTIENEIFYSRIAIYSVLFITGHEFRRRNLLLTAPFKHDKPLAIAGLILTATVVFVPDFNVWPYFLYMFFGTAMSVALASLYERYKLTFLDHLYGTNMTIYLYHWFIQAFTIAVYRKLGEPADPLNTLLFQSAAIIGGIYIPWILHRIITKHKSNKIAKSLCFISGIK